MKKIIRDLVKGVQPDYKETTDIFDILRDKQDKALKEAILLHEAQKQVHNNVFSHECNPYTNIFEFIQYIREVKKDIR